MIYTHTLDIYIYLVISKAIRNKIINKKWSIKNSNNPKKKMERRKKK